MPRTLKKTDIPQTTPEMGAVVPFPPPGIDAVSPDESSANPVREQTFGNRVDASERSAGEILRTARSQAAATYSSIKRHGAESYNYISFRCRRFVSDARYRATRAKNERPLQALGAIAGAAFIAGALIRVWRSRRHA